MSPIWIAVLLVQVTLAQCNDTRSSEEEIRLYLDVWKKSQEPPHESKDGLQNLTPENSIPQSEEGPLEAVNSSLAQRPLSKRTEVLILLTDFTNLIHLLLLVNPMSHQQYPEVWQSDLLADVQPKDNFTTIFDKLEAHNRDHQIESYVVDNQGHYIWVRYALLKAIHRAIAVEQRLARERAVVRRPPRFELIKTGGPIVAKKRERTKCGKYGRAYAKLKRAEEEFLKLTSDLSRDSSEVRSSQGERLRTRFGCQCEKGVTVVASKLR